MATLTYVYSDSTAVLGPLATYAEPHSYDLCSDHARRLTAPRGWEVVRLVPDDGTAAPRYDDWLALADAVREPEAVTTDEPGPDGLRRGHLRVLRDNGTTGGRRPSAGPTR